MERKQVKRMVSEQFSCLFQVHFVDGSAFSLYGRPSWDPSIPIQKVEKQVRSSMEDFYAPEASS